MQYYTHRQNKRKAISGGNSKRTLLVSLAYCTVLFRAITPPTRRVSAAGSAAK